MSELPDKRDADWSADERQEFEVFSKLEHWKRYDKWRMERTWAAITFEVARVDHGYQVTAANLTQPQLLPSRAAAIAFAFEWLRQHRRETTGL